MYDIKPLELEWKKYNKKRRRPWYLLGIVVTLLSASTFIFLKYNNTDFFKFNTSSRSVLNSVSEVRQNSILLNNALEKLETKKKNFTKIIDIKTHSISVDDNPMEEETKVVNHLVKKIKKPIIRVKQKVVEKSRKKIRLNIIKTTSIRAYEDVARRFHETHDADDSLFLAKRYYKKANYKKAEYWALETNKVNGYIEESWLIFAKAKVKLGRKSEAIRVLKSYSKKSNSHKAKSLIYKIKKGIF